MKYDINAGMYAIENETNNKRNIFLKQMLSPFIYLVT